jgi:DNA replication protein DnaC
MTMLNFNESGLSELLQDLKLKSWPELMSEDLGSVMPAEKIKIHGFIEKWARAEIAKRKTLQVTSRIKAARFRRLQTIDTYKFDYNKTTRAAQKKYLDLFDSIATDNLPSAVFTGSAGLGKTHLARALGYRACQKGISVLFITAAEMVNHLTNANRAFTLEAELGRYRRPQVLIIDELGYVTLDAQASNLFFQVISARHDQGLGTIATTNLPFGSFNQIFANNAIAHVIVDRLVADAEVFFLEGDSYRPIERQEKQSKKKSKLIAN